MISLIVPYLEIDAEKPALLKRFLDSVEGQYDELIVIDSKVDSYTKKVNDGLKKATGDFLIVGSDDIYCLYGSLRNLPRDCVSFPLVNGTTNGFGAIFCIPRDIYEKFGGLSEEYSIYCSDSDYIKMLEKNNIKYTPNVDINFHHPIGGRTVNKLASILETTKKDKEVFFNKWGCYPD